MSTITQQLHRLFNEDWEWELLDNPEYASQAGAHDTPWTASNALQDVSPAGYAKRVEHSQQMIAKVDALNLIEHRSELSRDDLLFAEMFRLSHVEMIEAIEKAPLHLIPVNSIGAGGICYSFLESIEWMRFETVRDYEVLLMRLKAFPHQIFQYIESMREGLKRGFAPMTLQVEGAIEAISRFATSDTFPEFDEALRLLDTPELTAAKPLKAPIILAIGELKHAFANMQSFLQNEYVSGLSYIAGCTSFPNGAEVYSLCLKFHTTTSLTAEQIHDIGLREVQRLENRYKHDVLLKLGFAENEFAKFVETVRHDPQFYATSEQELLNVYVQETANIRELMPQFFNEQPQSPMEIVQNKNGPCAYYLAGTDDGKRPGRFYVNTSNLTGKPKYESVALALHEGIPGHHHQLSLAMENRNIPRIFRHIEDRRYEVGPCRRPLFTSYAEGWALYCEYLGEEMGMYKTPYSLFGRLSMDMMRAVRLVVDTGIHNKGWTIPQAVDYMMEKTGMHRHEVTREIIRYSCWPGQACAYKIGQLEILQLRARAEETLKEKFHLKEFHSLCLNSGALPLNVLDDMVHRFIDERK